MGSADAGALRRWVDIRVPGAGEGGVERRAKEGKVTFAMLKSMLDSLSSAAAIVRPMAMLWRHLS